MYKITSKVPITEKAWGLNFINGEAVTENKDLAEKLKGKGYEVKEKKSEKK